VTPLARALKARQAYSEAQLAMRRAEQRLAATAREDADAVSALDAEDTVRFHGYVVAYRERIEREQTASEKPVSVPSAASEKGGL
jgi:hypothetical protein